ncbi:MAG: RNA-directed DNA polymerase, partial [Planctomycetaceae bacterium]|nr:RNA-directed DNA polymerase [Planctomycetaceae bacterium]
VGNPAALWTYYPRHLPQGAPTSPALANLSAHALDVRLQGLANAYAVRYTRYADDLTFSGTGRLGAALSEFIPLVTQIAQDERFLIHRAKRKVLRSGQRQSVTGVVVNRKLNVARDEYDRLKALLFNCVRHGPSSQNRDGHTDFAAYLAGRIGHVQYLNPQRGDRLRKLLAQIDWSK